ncbi:SOS response-associated peptidase [Natrinema versiforme]|uniref:SOS response-associated peptidase n=1 Tax=Natrinema versiforme TaxID=88724 RepID=A0A4V1G070_9EURY|nr:SOS response-associated peptidase [Natrinema versiforme]
MIALSAGCLSGDEDEGSPDDGTGDPEDGETDDLPDALASYETQPFQSPDRTTSPSAELIHDRDAADDWLDVRDSPPESLTDFIEDTDFEVAVLAKLEAGAPSPCHEMGLESIGIDESEENDDSLALRAAVQETADEKEACATQEVTVGRLVRATFESEPLSKLSVSIRDRHGQSHGIATASESVSESTSGNDGGTDNATESDADSE